MLHNHSVNQLFSALADSHRLELIEHLRVASPLSVSQLTEGKEITRQAITRHLDKLESAGLVRIEWRGRERMHSLEAAPLREIESWLEPFSAEWDARLERLRLHLDGRANRETEDETA